MTHNYLLKVTQTFIFYCNTWRQDRPVLSTLNICFPVSPFSAFICLFLFSHLFPGGQEADINMSSVIVSLQQLHNLQYNNRVIDVINVV